MIYLPEPQAMSLEITNDLLIVQIICENCVMLYKTPNNTINYLK